jgi:hypothetical protein
MTGFVIGKRTHLGKGEIFALGMMPSAFFTEAQKADVCVV